MSSSFRRRASLAAFAVLGLALPAHAAAATPFLSSTGKGPKGYTLSVSGGSGYAQASLFKSRKGVTQNHSVFTGNKVKYSAKKNLSSASLKAPFGPYGSVKMKFTATGKARKALPKGCTGVASKSRTGVLKGVVKYKLKSGGTTYKAFRLRGTLSTSGNLNCGGGGGGKVTHGYSLSTFGSNGLSNSSFSAYRNKGSKQVTQTASVSVNTLSGVTLQHSITVTRRGGQYFNPKTDLSGATAKAESPMKGSITYTGQSNPDQRDSFGEVTGAIKAVFDFVGKKTVSGSSGNMSKY